MEQYMPRDRFDDSKVRLVVRPHPALRGAEPVNLPWRWAGAILTGLAVVATVALRRAFQRESR